MACSATASGEYPGTLITVILFSDAATRSTLLKPAHLISTSTTPTSPSTFNTGALTSELTNAQTASYPFASLAVLGDRSVFT